MGSSSGKSSSGSGGSTVDIVAAAPSGGDDTVALAALLTQAGTQKRPLRLLPGKVYRAHGLTVPVGVTIDARDAVIKVPDGVTASNILTGAGPWTLRGGELDGNKANTSDPGVNTNGCGIFQSVAAGWAGKVRLLEDPVIHDVWQRGLFATSDISALTDADNAPDGVLIAERLEVFGCGGIGINLAGIGGVDLKSTYVHNNGSHGLRTYLCRAPRTPDVRALINAAHGMTSLYCVDQRVDGQFNGNTTNGLTIGGDSASATTAAGRRFQIGRVIARGNTSHGLCLDASVTGSNLPVPVNGQVGKVLAENNGGDGVVVNSSQFVEFGEIQANGNAAHGVDIASNGVSWRFVRATNNGQKGIALQGGGGSPNWGNHDIGGWYLSGNTPDDTFTIGTISACRFHAVQSAASSPPAALGREYKAEKAGATVRSNTATLAADPDLQFASVDPGVYDVFAYLPYDASTTGDIAWGVNMPAGASMSYGSDGPSGTIAAGNPNSITLNRLEFTGATGPASGGANVGTGTYALLRGTLLVPTAGAFVLKWAQNTAEVSNCTLHALASLKLTQIA